MVKRRESEESRVTESANVSWGDERAKNVISRLRTISPTHLLSDKIATDTASHYHVVQTLDEGLNLECLVAGSEYKRKGRRNFFTVFNLEALQYEPH